MFRALFINTLISAAAFFVVALIGVMLVPLLVGAYGLAGFGLIVLARLLLPAGLLGVFDWGFGELATQAVARARMDGDWRRAAAHVSLLMALALCMACVLALLLVLGAERVTQALHIGAGEAGRFARVVQATGLCLPPIFASLVLEGVVKGFEAFRDMRTCEVAATLAYAGGAVASVWLQAPYTLVAYAFLASYVLRAALVLALALRWSRGHRLLPAAWSKPDRQEIAQRCRLMAGNKMLGTLQTQAAPMLIGVLLGAAPVAVYDVLVRVPRFAKSILGLLTSALLPLAARLEAAADSERMTRLNRTGLIAAAALAFPPLAAGCVFSEPILRWWIGAEFERFWIWQALMFLVPALGVLVSYGATSLLVRTHVVAAMNRLVALQLVLQFGLALALIGWWQERAFIFGQVVAVGLTFIAQMHHIRREHGLGRRSLQPVWQVMVVVTGLGALSFLAGVPDLPQGAVSLVVAIAAWTLVAWSLLFWILPSAGQRRRLLDWRRPAGGAEVPDSHTHMNPKKFPRFQATSRGAGAKAGCGTRPTLTARTIATFARTVLACLHKHPARRSATYLGPYHLGSRA